MQYAHIIHVYDTYTCTITRVMAKWRTYVCIIHDTPSSDIITNNDNNLYEPRDKWVNPCVYILLLYIRHYTRVGDNDRHRFITQVCAMIHVSAYTIITIYYTRTQCCSNDVVKTHMHALMSIYIIILYIEYNRT